MSNKTNHKLNNIKFKQTIHQIIKIILKVMKPQMPIKKLNTKFNKILKIFTLPLVKMLTILKLKINKNKVIKKIKIFKKITLFNNKKIKYQKNKNNLSNKIFLKQQIVKTMQTVI